MFASIYIVAEKEIICFWREAAIFEESEKVVILAVDVTYSNRINMRSEMMSHDNTPQILIGASSSSRMGWLIKISRAFVQRYFISYS